MKLVRLAALAAAWGTLAIAGCGDDEEELALVTAEWSIAGRLDPGDCSAIGADFFEVVFFDLDGVFVAEVEADCRDFATSFDFFEGTYDVSTRMITSRQEGASETLFFDEVEVDRGVEVVLHADFIDVGIP